MVLIRFVIDCWFVNEWIWNCILFWFQRKYMIIVCVVVNVIIKDVKQGLLYIYFQCLEFFEIVFFLEVLFVGDKVQDVFFYLGYIKN